MKTIELYKFITDNNIEWHWDENDGADDVIIFPYDFQMPDFIKLFSPSAFDDGGIDCKIMHGYFAIWMNDICEYHGIELEDIFNKEN